MKNRKTAFVLALIFILLIGSASALYHYLGKDISAQQMIVHDDAPAKPTSTETTPEPAPSATSEPDPTPETEYSLAPDFRVFDREGNAVNLRSFFGKPIVLNFWASWCGPCRSEMPAFNAKHAEIGDQIHFVMVNMTDGGRETVKTASSFIDQNGYTFPVFFDTTSEAAATYGAYSLPTSFFIDAEGHVIAQAVGAIDAATLQQGIDLITG